MDSDLHIRSFRARHRVLRPDDVARCRAAQHALLDGELEAALAPLAGGDEVVVLRRIAARLVLSPDRSDTDNARAWSDALAAELSRALRQPPGSALLRFARRRQALQAFVDDLLRDDARRDWAWQRLGLLPAGHGVDRAVRHDALLRLLADDEVNGVPLLRSLLPTPAWAAVLARLADGELQGLATTVLARLRDDPQARFAAAPPTGLGEAPAPGAATPLPPAIWRATAPAAATPAPRAWARRLACLLATPALARHGAAAVDEALRAAAAPVAPRALADPAPARPPSTALPTPPEPSAQDASRAAAGTHDTGAGPAPPRPAAPASSRPDTDADPGATAEAPLDPAAPAPCPADCETDFGGLLFLLPLVESSGALPRLEDPAAWPPGSLPFALHRLALRLQPLAADDPAALAFCGLAPAAQPPWPARVPDAAQEHALADAQACIVEALAFRLPDWRGPALVDRVAGRHARVDAEPGWIDLWFSLRDVSVDLRRAALDLDPGFVPWLGVVLRFRYA